MQNTYREGDTVEVWGWVNSIRNTGFLPGVIRSIEVLDSGLSDVTVGIDVPGEAGIKVVRIGKRGGGRELRKA